METTYLLQQTQEDCLDYVLKVCRAFNLGMQILDAQHLTDGLDGAVANQAIPFGLFADKNLCLAELGEEIVINWKMKGKFSSETCYCLNLNSTCKPMFYSESSIPSI